MQHMSYRHHSTLTQRIYWEYLGLVQIWESVGIAAITYGIILNENTHI